MSADLSGGLVDLSHEELEAAKRYCRVDDPAEEYVLTQCVLAAREYLAGAGVSLPAWGTSRRALYDLVCHSLALSAFDRRDPVITGSVSDNPVLRRSLNQLKLTEPPVSKLDTGAQGGQ